MKILLAEDDLRLGKMLKTILSKNGINVKWVTNGESAYDECYADGYDVLVLDWMMPGMSGIKLCSILRSEEYQGKILMLTARDSLDDKVNGLNAGADDYLPKPFHASELLARIRAVTRRPATYRPNNAIEACGLVLDASSNVLSIVREGATSLTASAGVGAPAASVELTPRESEMLEALMNRAGLPVPKADLMARLWGPHVQAGENRVEVLVHSLRTKLARLGATACIETVRGVGYRLAEETSTTQ